MYTNRTPELGLPQYEGSDKLQRADMNAAYASLDAAVAVRPAADTDGRYPLARLAELAQAAEPDGLLDLRLAAVEDALDFKASLGADGRLRDEQMLPASRVPIAASGSLAAENVQQAVDMLAGRMQEGDTALEELESRFHESGSARDAAALGGVPASDIHRGSSIALHVSPEGSDMAGDGSEARPFKTLAHAADAIRRHHSVVTFYLHRGTYPRLSLSNSPIVNLRIIGMEGSRPSIDSIYLSNFNIAYFSNLHFASANKDTRFLELNWCRFAEMHDLEIAGNLNGECGIFCTRSQVYISQVSISRCTYGIRCRHSTLANIAGITGSGSTIGVESQASAATVNGLDSGFAATMYAKSDGGTLMGGGNLL